jgi:hypothetical protein
MIPVKTIQASFCTPFSARHICWLVGSLFLLLLVGCTPPPSPTSIPSTASFTPPAVTSTPILTTPSAALPAQPPESCRSIQSQVDLQQGSFPDYPQLIASYLNAGGDPAALNDQLYTGGVANQPVAAASTDLTGDGWLDEVVSIYDPASTTVPPAGRLLIYVCQDGQFELAYDQASAPGMGAPGIRYLQDLNNDGRAELVIGSPTCGASTCQEQVANLGFREGAFRNLLVGETTDLPEPDIRLSDPDGDRIFDLEIGGGSFGSVGAGAQRTLTRRWIYDPGTGLWDRSQDLPGPSGFRIHALYDADQAAQSGDYVVALRLYQRVISDPALAEYLNPEQEHANLVAYALFKQYVVQLLLHQTDQAEQSLVQLVESYPLASPGSAYVDLAKAFQQGYQSGGISAGCQVAQAYAAQHAETILAPLGSSVYGYANPDYQPQDVCPWK